jgi:hypothetical protein
LFSEPRPISDDEDKLLNIVNSQYKLSEFTDRKNFKSYDELKRKLNDVLSGDTFASKSAAEMAEDEDRPVRSAPEQRAAPAPVAKSKAAPMEDDDDDVMSYFEKIAQED